MLVLIYLGKYSVKLNSASFPYSVICIYIFLKRKVSLEASSDIEARAEQLQKKNVLKRKSMLIHF